MDIPENREYHVNLFDDAWVTIRIDLEEPDAIKAKFEGCDWTDFAGIDFNDIRGASDRLRDISEKINSVWVEYQAKQKTIKSKVKLENPVVQAPVVGTETIANN